MRLSIVIPAYNEEKDIEKAIQETRLCDVPDIEIIVVDDCSTDSTPQILAKYPMIKVLRNEPNRGHGYSVLRGLREATGDYIIYIDADRQIDLHDIPMIDFKQHDFMSGIRKDRQDKLFRIIVSICLRMTILFRHRMYIKDSNCPMKIYRREAVQSLLDKVPKTTIIPVACLEVLARKHGMRTLVFPIPHHPYDGVRKGFLQAINLNFIKFLWSASKEIISL